MQFFKNNNIRIKVCRLYEQNCYHVSWGARNVFQKIKKLAFNKKILVVYIKTCILYSDFEFLIENFTYNKRYRSATQHTQPLFGKLVYSACISEQYK